MKKVLVFGAALAFAASAMAEKKEINGQWYSMFPTKAQAKPVSHEAGGGGGANISYHGGAILVTANVVPIYWGTYWGSGTGASERSAMNSFYQQFGTNSHYGVITQYYDTTTGATRYIAAHALFSADWNDSTNPPTNVNDSAVQGEVLKYLSGAGHAFDDETIYEVFIPPGSYSSNGSSTSCGGPSLAYCAYHGSFSNAGRTIKYSIEPYPSCAGCHATGFSTVQDAQHFACHETREAVTDPVNAWWANSGAEADDKCAWSPAPFTDNGFGYQYEWSNAVRGCVK